MIRSEWPAVWMLAVSMKLPPRSRYSVMRASASRGEAPQPKSSPNVAAVGFADGYESASQFSREYRRLVGSPPGRDAEQLRRDWSTPLASGSLT
jgi:transcriptional regulator GlxA family with amidase domain